MLYLEFRVDCQLRLELGVSLCKQFNIIMFNHWLSTRFTRVTVVIGGEFFIFEFCYFVNRHLFIADSSLEVKCVDSRNTSCTHPYWMKRWEMTLLSNWYLKSLCSMGANGRLNALVLVEAPQNR